MPGLSTRLAAAVTPRSPSAPEDERLGEYLPEARTLFAELLEVELDAVEPGVGYRTGGRENRGIASDTIVVLAFSGGGTRAAAFSYGVLEFLRRTEVMTNLGGDAFLVGGTTPDGVTAGGATRGSGSGRRAARPNRLAPLRRHLES